MNAQICLIESPFTATDKRQKTKRKGRKRMAEREEKRHTGKNFLFMAHPCMTTGKTIALTIRIFVGKMMSLLFNTLARFVIAFLPRSKHLLISWIFMVKNGLKSCVGTNLLLLNRAGH